MKKFAVHQDRKRHFSKVLLEENETRMRIPKAFYPFLSRDSQTCERAVVQGPSGAHWVVNANKTRDGIYLEEGWEIFVRENGLQIYDVLVFRYDGSLQFSVHVFNMYGFPREECSTSVRSSPLAEERIKSGRPHTSLRSGERRFVEQQPRRQQDEDEADEDESGEDEEEHVTRPNGIDRGLTSRFPLFRIAVQPAYLKHHYLPIPGVVRRKYCSENLKEVIIRASDTCEKRWWRIRILHSKRHIRLGKGVTDFVNEKNGMNLKAGDVCTFEIVEKRSNQLVLRVHVSRH